MRRNTIMLLLFFGTNNYSGAQINDKFGLSVIGIQAPDLAFQVRLNYYIKSLMINAGVDINGVNTLGRVVGIYGYFGRATAYSRKHSVELGVDYNDVSSGVYTYEDGLSGSFLIPRNKYLAPSVGYRLLSKDVFIDRLIWNDLSLSFSCSYLIPLSNKDPIFRSGQYQNKNERFADRYLDGGINFRFRLVMII